MTSMAPTKQDGPKRASKRKSDAGILMLSDRFFDSYRLKRLRWIGYKKLHDLNEIIFSKSKAKHRSDASVN